MLSAKQPGPACRWERTNPVAVAVLAATVLVCVIFVVLFKINARLVEERDYTRQQLRRLQADLDNQQKLQRELLSEQEARLGALRSAVFRLEALEQLRRTEAERASLATKQWDRVSAKDAVKFDEKRKREQKKTVCTPNDDPLCAF